MRSFNSIIFKANNNNGLIVMQFLRPTNFINHFDGRKHTNKITVLFLKKLIPYYKSPNVYCMLNCDLIASSVCGS